MSTKRPVVLHVVFHCEGRRTYFLIRCFYVNPVCTSAIPSQLSMQKVQKRGAKGSKDFDITVGDHSVHSSAQLGALPQSIIIAITRLVNQK